MPSNLIRLGNKCNQNCIFCTVALDNERELSNEEVKKKIEFLSEKGADILTFTGGEPTIRKDLPDLIRFAKGKSFRRIELQTNGVLMSDKKLACEIARAGVDEVLVSLHSHRKRISERLTNVPGTFDKTLKGIENLLELDKRVCISHVINSLNYSDLTNFVKFVKNRFPSLSSFYFGFVRPNGNANFNRWIVPKISDIDFRIYGVFSYCREHKIPFSVEGIPLCYMQGYETHSSEVHRILSEPVFYMGSGDTQYDVHKFVIKNFRAKGEQCEFCFVKDICPGLWKEYADIYGTEELFPVFISKEGITKDVKERWVKWKKRQSQKS
ncbi:MAG: radical SAM protein [Candidatus Fermentimicrarchaeum limneticum]|uniref:Radical SAM protein n=1 Tax=Fermentimicrarchaeum limneticum TaxID=2795018 RepID=A0A7D6BMJ2_FERL1|nr:MAG: radical SAM protein [Candidatus Fermentimicrarchaeum limneticum]